LKPARGRIPAAGESALGVECPGTRRVTHVDA
jgi:hypothetical protein